VENEDEKCGYSAAVSTTPGTLTNTEQAYDCSDTGEHDALGCEFAVVVANHNHNKDKVYFYSRALQAAFFFLRSSDISLVYLLVRAARPKLSSLGDSIRKAGLQ
jgi:hypothetical protein